MLGLSLDNLWNHIKPYASYFRLKTQMVRLISGANELFYDRFPYKWEKHSKAQTIGRLLS